MARDAYTDHEIACLVALDVDAYTGKPEDAEVVLTTRFERDVRRREVWTHYLDARGRAVYRQEIIDQVRDLVTEYGFNTNYELV